MTQAMPWIFVALAALAVGAVVVSFWQSIRALLGLVEEGEVAEERFADADRDLLARRHAILASLRDLDFDHEAGKLSDEDFHEARLRLRGEAKTVMQAIDAAIGPHRTAIEAQIDARLGASPKAAGTARTEAEAETEAEALSFVPGVCSSCTTKNDPDAAFCKRCGKPLAKETAS